MRSHGVTAKNCVGAQVHDVEEAYSFQEPPEERRAMEEEFEMERGRRSLASLLESDDEDIIVANAHEQDESLLVRPLP